MSWPRQIAPQQDPDATAKRMLEDASQQLASGNPAQSLQTILSLLSALHLPEEAAAVAIKVQEAMAQDPSRDINAQLASLLGSLNLSTRGELDSNRGVPLPRPLQIPLTSFQPGSNMQNNTVDIEMKDHIYVSEKEKLPLENSQMQLSYKGGGATAGAGDGEESYLCDRCQSVISVARKAAHDETWCPALHTHL